MERLSRHDKLDETNIAFGETADRAGAAWVPGQRSACAAST
jgi:hypothetical protein